MKSDPSWPGPASLSRRPSCRAAAREKGPINVRKRTRVTVSLAAVCTLLGGIALSAAMSAAPALADYAAQRQRRRRRRVGHPAVHASTSALTVTSPATWATTLQETCTSSSAWTPPPTRTPAPPGPTAARSPTRSPLNPTAVYRAGTFPVQRINGSGAGINALLADTSAADPYINFARMSSNPTTANGATAVTNGWQGLQDFVLGTENLREAAASPTTTLRPACRASSCTPSTPPTPAAA